MGSYADTIPTDGDGDKFHGVVTDNSGTNDIVAVKGVNRTTQNGEVVADMAVSLDGETVNVTGTTSITTGATDDAAAAGQIFPMAGVYQATADEVDDGDVGRVRMDKGRVLMTTGNYRHVDLSGLMSDRASFSYSYNLYGYEYPGAKIIHVRNELDVDIDIVLRGRHPAYGYSYGNIITATLTKGNDIWMMPMDNVGSSASTWYVAVPILSVSFPRLELIISTASTPTSGAWFAAVTLC